MPDPLCAFVGQGAALTAAAWAAAAANADGGGPFQRLGEGWGAALREAWTAEAVRTVPAERRAAAGDAEELFAYARPPTKRERLEKGERHAEQHQGWADAPKEKRRRAAEEQTAAQAALLGPLAAADTTASLGGAPMRRPSAIVAAVLHQPIAAERAVNQTINPYYRTGTVRAWAEAAQIIFAFTPNSAAAERVFSMLKSMFGDQQMETLADIIQTALMLRINERRVDPKTNKLVVDPKGKQVLESIRGSVGVCSVAGVYRTGKSYILNQLAGRDSGFGVGSSVQACTKGIWLWGAPIERRGSSAAAAGAPDYVLLLDTEGLQSLCQTEGHDAKIFCLAILLSSFFLYNSEKAINSAAIDQLSLVAQLTKKIRVHAAGNGGGGSDAAELAEVMPSFLWLLRDFQLELEDEQGRPISPDAYLEQSLRAQPGSSAAVQEQNGTRAAIRDLFPRRSCVTLRHPTLGTKLPDSALKQLPAIDKLHPAFRDGVIDLKQRVFGEIRAKAVGGAAATGPMLLGLAEAFVRAVNEGAVPTISTAWQAVLTIECQKALDQAAAIFRAKLSGAAEAEPVAGEAEWAAAVAAARDEALKRFQSVSVGEGRAAFEEKLEAAMRDEQARAEQVRAAKSEAVCARVAASLGARLEAGARSGAPSELAPLLEQTLSDYLAQSHGPAQQAGLPAATLERARRDAEERAKEDLRRASAEHAMALQAAKAETAAAAAAAAAAERRAKAAEASLAATQAELSSARADASGEVAGLREKLSAAEAKLKEAAASLAAEREASAAAGRERGQAQGELRASRSALENAKEDLAREKKMKEVETKRLADKVEDLKERLAAAEAVNAAAPPPQPDDDEATAPGKRHRSGSAVRTPSLDPVAEAPEAAEAAEAADPALASSSGTNRRSSVIPPSQLAVPVLQSKLRQKLGSGAKLPKKKQELINLAMQHGISG
ncbi:hypothetical protein EMIHUDRAFT_470932 [Emiliania huxleyi CCMP1516]|uniref:GB1/RHD3-type G domain-containing protein n=3 Tax=Emiliania huxleyi TaxID=2903 RepID=A0A0D3IIF2_EMIH1|nr:hypothetical protein EMIHUDRAFT_470932 [Emiliania huxleyi CCMP1516]EOD11037.1 hypothetical protein EMIHUDRAFT_470932 [Emiliania huxleyi CCMP1516]|eukprot:XP_005763466.1 hypothetical protein EMIHUDRAFT_470932 [Emiliania huxleyi CCMP1516]